jgi:glutaconyl-CoA/methylmalonyl-CoA decarboxylase subunit gamma
MSSKTYHIKLNGKVYEVEIEEVQPGQVPQQEAKVDEKSMKATAGQGGEEIKAPMPGNLLDIVVKEGQVVKKGEVVAILEAMKMENEIVAPGDGQIVSINVEKGQNINMGDVILKIA